MTSKLLLWSDSWVNNIDPPDELLTPRQAAALIGITADTIGDWAREGKLPAQRTSATGHRRFRRSDVEAYIASVNQPAAAAS